VKDAPIPRDLRAKTIIYVHGIGNKPVASVLKCQWDTALFGLEVGERSRMAYWVNRDYYPRALNETCVSGDRVSLDDEEASTRAIMALGGEGGEEVKAIANEVTALTSEDSHQEKVLLSIANKIYNQSTSRIPPNISARGVRAKVLPLPEPVRKLIAGKLTRAFLRDVNDFLFHKKRRAVMHEALKERLDAGGGPFVVIAHSQGSMIAYDVLREIKKGQCDVSLLVTLGSPLGLQEVQDYFRRGPNAALQKPACVRRWLNVADRLDPVAFDPNLSNDFRGVENIPVSTHGLDGFGINVDSPWHPHSGTGYLKNGDVRDAVRTTVDTSFGQAVAPFLLTKDLVSSLEDGDSGYRHPVLIQLATIESGRSPDLREIDHTADEVIARIEKMAGKDTEAAAVERLRHFVAASLTRFELETIRSHHPDLEVQVIWRNARKKALINNSSHTVQARPANLGYSADGRGIVWAVLDTGIRADHPHFHKYDNIKRQWDCTKHGPAVRLEKTDKRFSTLDGHGHGTHVAGIIAGMLELKPEQVFSGMAPRCALYGFKVLDDQGNGQDSWIIKALDEIARINERAGRLIVHGVNLSLGGNFDPSVYGCGHTPLCQELRRLWQQGVLVCLAAGNEGYAILSGREGEMQANLDLTIGDPANLEEAIAVGSVHKTNPHTYGISYFSSRGPTADGRRKPDLVAPGEKILSARHDWTRPSKVTRARVDDYFVEMDGTSMASPHVSGVLAAFLSLRREFIGYPDRVKQILLSNCIDLQRDVYAQGAGMPNLIKMLALY
jgi:subtilisin family serine protease